jgi:dCMP deaminase
MTRPNFEEIYMAFAQSLARRSTCERLQVGCVITTSNYRQVVAIGYNGGPAGGRNECKRDEHGEVVPGKCQHLHGEQNAIIGCTHIGPKIVFVTHQPCEMCSIALVNLSAAAGPIEKVIYAEPYRDASGLEVLQQAGIPVFHYTHV